MPCPDNVSPSLFRRSNEAEAVRVANLPWPWLTFGLNELVARREDADPGPPDDRDRIGAKARQQANLRRPDGRPGLEDQ